MENPSGADTIHHTYGMYYQTIKNTVGIEMSRDSPKLK